MSVFHPLPSVRVSARRPFMSAVRRIMIVGQPGCGKSTLAVALGERTGLPVIHIDKIQWQAGWVERSKAEKTRLCREAEQGERWIFEGGHSETWQNRIERADMLICIHRSLSVRLWRVVMRAVRGLGRTRSDMAEGCPERLSSLPQFVAYILATRYIGAARVAQLASAAPDRCTVIHVRSDAEIAALLGTFRERFVHQSD